MPIFVSSVESKEENKKLTDVLNSNNSYRTAITIDEALKNHIPYKQMRYTDMVNKNHITPEMCEKILDNKADIEGGKIVYTRARLRKKLEAKR